MQLVAHHAAKSEVYAVCSRGGSSMGNSRLLRIFLPDLTDSSSSVMDPTTFLGKLFSLPSGPAEKSVA